MPVVAIDGTSGTGKSTVSRAVARALGVACFDTGAMYRAVGLAARRHELDLAEEAPIVALLQELDIQVSDSAVGDTDDDAHVTLNGEDVSTAIRTAEAGQAASLVGIHPVVRAELVRRQQEWVRNKGGAVVEGRDIGSVVLPDADLKVFLTASGGERARRRAAQLDSSLLATAADIASRDERDTSRDADPLHVDADSLVIDTTDLAIEDVVRQILERIPHL
jgi:cytidylate kinase